jgi:uncharacterized protein
MTATNPKAARAGDVRLEPLSRYECWQLVTEVAGPDGIARVVWSVADGPAIVPVNYTVADGFLWFQTTADSRVARECCGQRVLVEVDQVHVPSHTGWSVVVAGTATCLDAASDRGLLGNTLLVWPDGPRDVLVRVAPEELTGRRLGQG